MMRIRAVDGGAAWTIICAKGVRTMRIRDQAGNPVEGDPVEIVNSSEPWSEYELEDGTVLRIKFVLGAAYRLKNRWNEDGEPLYVTKAQTVVMARVPDDLKRGPDA